MRQRLFLRRRRIEQGRHHDRRAAEMRDLVSADGVVHRGRAHLAQAHMCAGHDRDRPREAPAVAVEHRQGPEIDASLAHAAGEHVADGEEISAAMVIDHALGVAGRARGVIERDRVPFVVRHRPRKARIARRDEVLVLDRAQPLAGAGEFGIVIVDDQRLHLGKRERLLRELGEFAVGDQHLGVGVFELEGDNGGIEPGVDGVEHCPSHRHAVVAFEHRRRVGEHGGDGVAARDPALGERRRQLPRAGVEIGVAPAHGPMNDRGAVGKHGGRPFQERQRGERLEVRGVAVEISVVGCARHGGSPRHLQCAQA
jgi:hypothetical protein